MKDPALDSLIYLDYNATTPLDRRVAEEMQPYLTGIFGNPSSGHAQGRAARRAIDRARDRVAGLLGARAGNIVFTSGGTESNNHAIRGAALSRADRGRHIVTSAVEHPAVTAVCKYLESRGFTTTYVPVDPTGRIDPAAVAEAFTAETVLVSLMHANNEVGTIQPVAEVAALARERGILSHSDCAQSTGKIPVRMDRLGVDMLSVAGHKLYGPKGVGALCLRDELVLPPLMYGAGHEAGRRPGTENLLGVVGLGMACELALSGSGEEPLRLASLRDRLEAGLLEAFPAARVHGDPQRRLPNTSSIAFPGRDAAAIMAAMPEVAVSAGAACHDGTTVCSPVLQAMGVESDLAAGTLRFSVGRMTTPEEIDRAVPRIVAALRAAGS